MDISPPRFPTISMDRPCSALLAEFRPRAVRFFALSVGLAVFGMASHSAQAQLSYSSDAFASGNWSTSTHWTPNIVAGPNSVGASVGKTNGGVLTTTTLDITNRTIG